MPHPLLEPATIAVTPAEYLPAAGEVFAFFGSNTQDSGNESYGIEVAGERFFVKTAGRPNAPRADPKSPTHTERIDALRNAVVLRRAIDHSALPELHNVIESPTGPLLVYAWVEGEHLGRSQNSEGNTRFRALSPEEICRALGDIYDVHVLCEAAGYVACDFYDGALIYDFDRRRMHLMDLDLYHRGPFTNDMGRLFGSSKFMAPEEFERGATIDYRTTVFNMGRTAAVLLSDFSLDREPFRGSDAQYAVMVRACQPDPSQRYPAVADFAAAWGAASVT